MTDILDLARRWAGSDPDPRSRDELLALVESGDIAQLTDRMAGALDFGTAGLRGRVEAGSNRMNRATVIRTTRGLADHLLATSGPERGPVVVGMDARPSSGRLLLDTVGVLIAAGLEVRYVDEPTPTPMVAYLANVLGAEAAVVITASHNPPADNGYKVYSSNGVQIVPPEDRHIADWIARVGAADVVPRIDDPFADPRASRVPDGVLSGYHQAILSDVPQVAADRDLRIVYSAMHGVGGGTVESLFERAGFAPLIPVAEQFEPDGRFPTVAFPNPEEPGAMDLSHRLAEQVGAQLVIANDPDADRLAVSLPRQGSWHQLTGNQIGALLADLLLRNTPATKPFVVQSIVSSPMLAAIATAHGAGHHRTLTGFKWIWNAALDLEAAGEGTFVFGYEEALGYSVSPAVRDKDGMSAALAFALLTGEAARQGKTPWDHLGRLYGEHGLWVSAQQSVVREGIAGAEEITSAMDSLAGRRPAELAGFPVTDLTDYRVGGEDRPRWLADSPLVEFQLGEAGRALIRPSGTEPKIKIYVDLRGDAGDDWMAAEQELAGTASAVAAAVAEFAGLGG